MLSESHLLPGRRSLLDLGIEDSPGGVYPNHIEYEYEENVRLLTQTTLLSFPLPLLPLVLILILILKKAKERNRHILSYETKGGLWMLLCGV